jgi:hypothetical protein
LVYLRPKEALASRGFQVVVFGHTHLVKEFVEAMADNQLERWRRLVPTFARIDLEGESLVSADVFLLDEEGRVRPVGARI